MTLTALVPYGAASNFVQLGATRNTFRVHVPNRVDCASVKTCTVLNGVLPRKRLGIAGTIQTSCHENVGALVKCVGGGNGASGANVHVPVGKGSSLGHVLAREHVVAVERLCSG